MVEVVDEEDGAQLLGLEGAGQLHEQVHAGIPHAVQIVIQLPILHHARPTTCFAAGKRHMLLHISETVCLQTHRTQVCALHHTGTACPAFEASLQSFAQCTQS